MLARVLSGSGAPPFSPSAGVFAGSALVASPELSTAKVLPFVGKPPRTLLEIAAGLPAGASGAKSVATVAVAAAGADSAVATAAGVRLGVTAAFAEAGAASATAIASRSRGRRIARRYRGE